MGSLASAAGARTRKLPRMARGTRSVGKRMRKPRDGHAPPQAKRCRRRSAEARRRGTDGSRARRPWTGLHAAAFLGLDAKLLAAALAAARRADGVPRVAVHADLLDEGAGLRLSELGHVRVTWDSAGHAGSHINTLRATGTVANLYGPRCLTAPHEHPGAAAGARARPRDAHRLRRHRGAGAHAPRLRRVPHALRRRGLSFPQRPHGARGPRAGARGVLLPARAAAAGRAGAAEARVRRAPARRAPHEVGPRYSAWWRRTSALLRDEA